MGLGPVVETQNFSTFKEFWDAVSPLGEFGKKMKGFIYRGESSKNWKLLPKILRCQQDDKGEPERIYREIKSISEFFLEANYQGLKVPNNKMIHCSPDEIMGTDLYWISDEFEETAALAQHYGLPTRLLDWTKDIFVAFYFASTGVMEKEKDNTEPSLVIYALNYGFLKEEIKKWEHAKTSYGREPFPIKFLIPHYSDNPNIMAQSGILSYSEVRIVRYSTNTWKLDYTPLDEKLQELIDDKDHYYHISEPETLLYKFIIPPSEASAMFDFISRFNYSYSRIFPGYNGIMKTLKEKITYKELIQYDRHMFLTDTLCPLCRAGFTGRALSQRLHLTQHIPQGGP